MEVQEERPPPYAHNDPDTLHLPSVPTQDPPSSVAAAHVVATNGVHLPDLKSLGLPAATHSRSASNPLENYVSPLFPVQSAESQQWQNTNSASVSFPRVPLTAPRSAADMDVGSPMDTESIVSIDEQSNGTAPKSARNSKELLAAEAIVGLGNPDYAMSPTGRSATLPPQSNSSAAQDREPLLSLVTSRHPWLGGTINGSLSAYSSTKAYSPRFIQSSANFLERNFANTVGTVGRRTGVESSLRRYLGEGRPNEHESGSHKRRRTDNDMMDIEKGLQTPPVRAARTRGDSDISFAREEALPPYDTNRSPDYEERTTANGHARQLAMLNRPEKQREDSSQSPHWSTRVMITTSGLGAALSEKSLRSLKFCLNILREATVHIGNAMRALRMVLEDFEKANSRYSGQDEKGVGSRQLMRDLEEKHREEESRRLAERIKALSQDIWETLKKVCASVSHYTGGALPDNARDFVRRQLMSVPQRWQAVNAASSQNGQESESTAPAEVRGANRMLAFAKEGLEMMGQVSAVVESTIDSAEQWLDSLGRKRKNESSATPRDEKLVDGLPVAPMLPSQK